MPAPGALWPRYLVVRAVLAGPGLGGGSGRRTRTEGWSGMKTTIIFGIILVVAGVLVLVVARPTDGPGTETALAGASLPGDANCDEVVNSIDAAFVPQSESTYASR